jgi:hypothetical protein
VKPEFGSCACSADGLDGITIAGLGVGLTLGVLNIAEELRAV